MAVQVRTRRLSNPSMRKHKKKLDKRFGSGSGRWFGSSVKRNRKSPKAPKKNPAKRKLSPKQIAIFGTPRQKAALRASKSRRRNPQGYGGAKYKKSVKATKGRLKHRKQYHGIVKNTLQKVARRSKRRKNVGEIVSIALAGLNPGKKRGSRTMAKRRKARKSTAVATRRRVSRRRKNPGVARRRRVSHRAPVARRRRRRSNPMFRVRRIRRTHRRSNPGKMLPSGIMTKAIGVIAGAVASRYLTQAVLGGNNTSYIGYAGNVVAAWGLSMVAKKVTKSGELAQSILLGGLVSVVLRVLQDKTSIGQYVNASLAGAGKGGDAGIGIISDSSFYLPQTFANGSMTNANVPRAITSYVGSQMAQVNAMKAAGSPKGVGTMRGRSARGVV